MGQPSLDRGATNVAWGVAEPNALGGDDGPAQPTLLVTHATTTYERWVKPVLDRCLAFVLLVVFSPVMLIVGALVRLSLGAPVLLRQKARGSRRSSLRAAQVPHHARRPFAEIIDDAFDGRDRRITHKHPNDPRLTLVGRTLRKWSLDELPQLLDVLDGKLSIVGPRPELVGIVANYEPWQHGRHAVKPGLTGLWQVTARGEGEMHQHTELDIEYARKVTFRQDVKIMLLTIPAVLAHKGY